MNSLTLWAVLIIGLLLILPMIKDQSTYFNTKFNTPLLSVFRCFPELLLIIPVLGIIYNIVSILEQKKYLRIYHVLKELSKKVIFAVSLITIVESFCFILKFLRISPANLWDPNLTPYLIHVWDQYYSLDEKLQLFWVMVLIQLIFIFLSLFLSRMKYKESHESKYHSYVSFDLYFYYLLILIHMFIIMFIIMCITWDPIFVEHLLNPIISGSSRPCDWVHII